MKRIGRWLCVAALLVTFMVPAVYGQSNRFDFDDDAVRGLRYAAWEAGTLFGSAATPYSRGDLQLVADRVATGRYAGSLSPEAARAIAGMEAVVALESAAGLSAYSAGQGRAVDSMGLGASIRADTSLEAYPRLYESGSVAIPWDWSERTPILSIPMELYALDAFYARAALELREDHNAIERIVEPANGSNWLESLDYVDYTFPFEAFVGAEYGPLSVSFGRDKLRWGPGNTGTLVLSDSPDFYDYVDAGVTGDWFSYHFARISIDPSLRDSELAVLGNSFESAKNLYLHRYEFLLFNRIALGLVEGLMVGGIEPDIAYTNPFLVLHNRFAWNATFADGLAGNEFFTAASILGAELRVNPWRYMELYGSFAMNQFQTQYELDRYAGAADVMPNAYAWQAGGEVAYPLLGGWIRATVEYVFTNPWMYIRENRFNSFTWRRRLTSNVVGADQLTDAFLGYHYGPDAKVFYTAAGWDAPGKLSFMASLEYAERGEQNLYTPYDEGDDAVGLVTPTGIPELSTILALEASWSPLPGLSVYGSLASSSILNMGHSSGIKAVSVDSLLGITVSFPQVLGRDH